MTWHMYNKNEVDATWDSLTASLACHKKDSLWSQPPWECIPTLGLIYCVTLYIVGKFPDLSVFQSPHLQWADNNSMPASLNCGD